MNRHLLAALSALALTSACSLPAPGPARAGSMPAVAVAADEGMLPLSCSAQVVHHECEGGAHIDATYPTADTACIRYLGVVHPMRIAISASGARYVGDALEWWTKGREGTLSRLLEDGTSGEIIERCVVQAEPGR